MYIILGSIKLARNILAYDIAVLDCLLMVLLKLPSLWCSSMRSFAPVVKA